MKLPDTSLEAAFKWEAQHVPHGARKMRGVVLDATTRISVRTVSPEEAPVGLVHGEVTAYFSTFRDVAVDGSLCHRGIFLTRHRDAGSIRVLADGRSFAPFARTDDFGPDAVALTPHDMAELRGIDGEIPSSRRFDAARLGLGNCDATEEAVHAKAASWFVCDGLVYAPCLPPTGLANEKGDSRITNSSSRGIDGRVSEIFWGAAMDDRSKPVHAGLRMEKHRGVVRQPWYDAGPGQRVVRLILEGMTFNPGHSQNSMKLALDLVEAAGLTMHDERGMPVDRLGDYDGETCHRLVRRIHDRNRPLGQNSSKTPSIAEMALDGELMLVPVLSPVPDAPSNDEDASLALGM